MCIFSLFVIIERLTDFTKVKKMHILQIKTRAPQGPWTSTLWGDSANCCSPVNLTCPANWKFASSFDLNPKYCVWNICFCHFVCCFSFLNQTLLRILLGPPALPSCEPNMCCCGPTAPSACAVWKYRMVSQSSIKQKMMKMMKAADGPLMLTCFRPSHRLCLMFSGCCTTSTRQENLNNKPSWKKTKTKLFTPFSFFLFMISFKSSPNNTWTGRHCHHHHHHPQDVLMADMSEREASSCRSTWTGSAGPSETTNRWTWSVCSLEGLIWTWAWSGLVSISSQWSCATLAPFTPEWLLLGTSVFNWLECFTLKRFKHFILATVMKDDSGDIHSSSSSLPLAH